MRNNTTANAVCLSSGQVGQHLLEATVGGGSSDITLVCCHASAKGRGFPGIHNSFEHIALMLRGGA